MVYLFVKANFYLHLVHTSFILDLISRGDPGVIVDSGGRGTQGVLSNVMGRKEIQGKWEGEGERER